MKASEIKIVLPVFGQSKWSMASIETKTDSQRLLCDESDVQDYVATHGDVDVVLDAVANVYRVAEFDAVREAYIASKVRDCARYGCE